MTSYLKWGLLGLAVLMLTLLGLLFAAFDSQPGIVEKHALSYDDVASIKAIIKANHPKRQVSGQIREVRLSQRELNLLVTYALKRFPHINLQGQLLKKHVKLQGSVHIPDLPFGDYLNIEAELTDAPARLRLTALSIGSLAVPAWLVQPLSQALHERLLQRSPGYRGAIQAVEEYNIDDQSLYVRYRWHEKLFSDLRSDGGRLLFSKNEQQIVKIYQEKIVEVSQQIEGRWTSLNIFLRPLFILAQQRSHNGSDPVAENRALITALAMYIAGAHASYFVPEAIKPAKPARQILLLLRFRHDLMQHFMLSAAVTVSAGSGLADAVGLFKEIDDSQGGSGFSFADLLADRAGIRFAELATADRKEARRVQKLMAESRREANYMPRVDALPEGIMELEFRSRYEDLDSASYQLVENEIQRRIATCALYQTH